jgi:hypothetical protein
MGSVPPRDGTRLPRNKLSEAIAGRYNQFDAE